MVDHCNQENKLNEKLLQLSNNTMETRDSDYGSLSQDYQRPSLREITTREFYQQDNWFDNLCETLFKVKARNTTIKSEMYNGVIHFISCLYCLAVVPQQLSAAGYDSNNTVVAVALSTGIGSICCGLFANLPFVLAPPTVVTIFLSVYLQQNNIGPREGNLGVIISGAFLMLFGWRPLGEFIRLLIPIPIQVGTVVGVGLLTTLAGSTEVKFVISGTYKILRMGHITMEIAIVFAGVIIICVAMRYHQKGSFCICVVFCSVMWWLYDLSFPEEIFAMPTITTANFNGIEPSHLPLLTVDLLFLYVLYLNGLMTSLSNLAVLTREDGATPRGYVQLFSEPSLAMAADSELGVPEVSSDDSLSREIDIPLVKNTIAYTVVNNRWEVAAGLSSTGCFENMSFVNNVWTVRGGSHVALVSAQIVKAIEQIFEKKGISVTPATIRNKLMVFVNCKIENPAFEGQTKDSLNSKPSTFGSTCKLPAAFLKECLTKTGVVESIMEDIATKEQNKALKTSKSGRKQIIDIPKLEDAHEAGGPNALDCTLILTEGDSAKALAVAGLEVVGRQSFGVMPLRGKVLNVRVASRSQALKNEEFVNLCKALGLDFKKTYKNGLEKEGLRYGKVMIMCDQDTDGSHIKGLVINLFHHFWPGLMQHEGFLQQFITPIVKTKLKGKGKEDKSFYSIPEFKQWLAGRGATTSDINIKYYKGLGTNTAAEGREYFKSLDMHRKVFQAIRVADDSAIDLAFNKDKAFDRKNWLSTQHHPETFLDPYHPSVSYSEFINKELIHFSYADIQRSIPNVIDGLKPSQRKVLHGCFKKNLVKEEAKVVQIAGYIAEHTAYHHGETSLHATIINMAQDYVGSNNVPFLVASGQFGTRAQGGKDFASPRYVFTRLSPMTRLLFPEEDDELLEYEEEDGQRVEPTFFVPVIPTLLLNGSQGIGTGWSTSVPTFHLPHVVEQVRRRVLGLASTASKPLAPYVLGFTGTIKPVEQTDPALSPTQYRTEGIIARTAPARIVISELPCGVWTDDYKKFLMGMVERGDIKEFKEFHTSDTVRFEISATKVAVDEFVEKNLATVFKLSSSISLTNMHAFDRNGKIHKYLTPDDILDAHFEVRFQAYERRKAALERKFAAEEMRSRNKSRFITCILNEEISVIAARGTGKSATDVVRDLRARGFDTEQGIHRVLDGTALSGGGDDAEDEEDEVDRGSYSYLLDMPIFSLTDERSLRLQHRAEEAAEKLKQVSAQTVQDLWIADLDRISFAYDDVLSGEK